MSYRKSSQQPQVIKLLMAHEYIKGDDILLSQK